MPSSKLFVKLLLVATLSFLLLSGLTVAQKDKDKGNKKQKLAAPIAPEPVPRTPYSDVRREQLLNGLQIISLENQTEAKVTCELVIRGGAMFDLVGKAGLADLTVESLLAVYPNLDSDLESLQAKLDWGVTLDSTWFRLEAPASNLQDAMSRVARLLVVDNIRQDAFKNAQQAQLGKFAALKMTPAAQADEAFFTTLYGDHPYAHNVVGTAATIPTIRYGDVAEFYKRVYLGNNMFVLVQGNLKHERAMSLFRMYFGGWVKGVPAPPTFRPPQRTLEVRVQKVEQPDAPNVEIRGGVLGVSHTDADFIPTMLLARILENRIRQLDAQATAHFAPRMLAAPLFFSASVPTSNAVEYSRRATDIFASLNKAEFTEAELAAAQSSLLNEHRNRPVHEYLREIATFKLPETYPLTYETKVKAVATSDLQRVAKRLLEANALTLLVLGKVTENFKSQS